MYIAWLGEADRRALIFAAGVVFGSASYLTLEVWL